MKNDIAVIYRFARTADDIADNFNLPREQKLNELKKFKIEFVKSLTGYYESDFWEALHHTIINRKLSAKHFFDLLEAFEFDASGNDFETFSDILNYCEKSANPVGRIILELYDIRDNVAVRFSDKICAALQLANFYQDVLIDAPHGRIYFPNDELKKFGIKKSDLTSLTFTENFARLLEFSVNRAREMFAEGKNLVKILPPGLDNQIMWTILAGEEILAKIEKQNYNVFLNRPKINAFDVIKILFAAPFRKKQIDYEWKFLE